MEVFLSTAWRCLKGESGLPSILPAREAVDVAKGRSREVRLFCEGLEKFREILYTEPVDESLASSGVADNHNREKPIFSDTMVVADNEQVDSSVERSRGCRDGLDAVVDKAIRDGSIGHGAVVEDQSVASLESTIGKEPTAPADTLHGLAHHGAESCGTAIVAGEGQAEERYIESPIEQGRDPPDATAGTDLTASAVIIQNQQHPIPEKIIVPAIEADQKRRKYVLTTKDDDLFRSMNATDQTPPTSPGGESTCSTLVNPLSRKVSPSDSTMGAEASPTAVKDFAYSSWDSNHVRDPLSIVEENLKLELVRQLRKKKMGLEWKDYRVAEKQKGRNQALCADVEEARRNLPNREVRADLAKVHANARSAGETFEDQEKERSPQNHLGCAGTFAASAYACTQRLDNATETSGEGLDDVGSQGCIQQEEIVESKRPSPIEALDRQISEELQVGCVACKDSATASGATQLKPNAEESLGRSEGKVDDDLFGKPVLDAAMLLGTSNSLDPAVSEAINNVKVRGVAIFQGIPYTGPKKHKEASTDDETKVLNTSKAQTENFPEANLPKVFTHSKDQYLTIDYHQAMGDPSNKNLKEPESKDSTPSEFSGAGDVFEANDDNSPPAVLHPQTGTDEHNDTQGTCIGHEGGSNGNFEFSEAAGPATLWGILQYTWCEIKAESQAYTVEETTGVSDAAGPATLWGILRSSQSENKAEDRRVIEGEGVVVSAVPGPATLWGILQSDAHESEAGEQEDADDAAAETPEREIPELELPEPAISEAATESGEVAAPMLQDSDLSAIEEEAEEEAEEDAEENPEVDPEVPYGPTNTPVDATGAGWAPHSKGSEASPKVSRYIYDDEDAKSGGSDAVTRSVPSLSAIPAEKECPEESEVGRVQAPSDFGDVYRSHDDFGAGVDGEDHKTSNVAIVRSSNALAQTDDVLSGGEQALSLRPSDISSPRAVSQPEAEVSDIIPPISQPNEMSKTQKRKLERRRAAAKKAEARELMQKKEEEVAESMRWKEEDEDEDKEGEAGRAPASLAQRLAEEDSKLGEKRRMLQLARMARMEKVGATFKSVGKSAGR